MKRALTALALIAVITPANAAYWGDTSVQRAAFIQAAAVFAATNCPISVNFKAVEVAITAIGVTPAQMEEDGEPKRLMLNWVDWLMKRRNKENPNMDSCVNVYRMFGPKGEEVPGLLYIKR